jgi:hypothetical protein
MRPQRQPYPSRVAVLVDGAIAARFGTILRVDIVGEWRKSGIAS